MRVIVCGGRDFLDRKWAHERLSVVDSKLNIEWVIEGGANGADRIGRSWAIINGVHYTTVRADWEQYGKRAGYLRNLEMATKYRPHAVIVMPGGRGTQMMIDIAKERGIPRIYLTKVSVD